MSIPNDGCRLSTIFNGSTASSSVDTEAKALEDTSTLGHRASWSWTSDSALPSRMVSVYDSEKELSFNEQRRTSAVASSIGLVPRASPSIDTLDEFPADRFHYDSSPIGQGSSGEIYCGVDLTFNRAVAIKVMPRRFINFALQEFEVGWAMRGNPHVADVYGLFKDQNSIYLVQELMDGKNLQMVLVENPEGLQEAVVRNIFKSIVRIVLDLHEKKIIHRDIKAANILLGAGNRVSLVDFGSSASSHCRRRSLAGTFSMMAPETVGRGDDTGYDAKVDIWSLGILLFELLTGRVPFPASNSFDFMHRCEMGQECFELTKSQRDLLKRKSSREACDLICAMLEFDPDARIDIAQVLSHPWVIANTENKEMF